MHGTTHRRHRRPRPISSGHLEHCDRFERLAIWTVRVMGGRLGFRIAVASFLVWAASGPYFDYHESWKTVFYVGTSSVTFLTVFLARNAQIRSSKALHLKLDELIYAVNKADNRLIAAENLAERELDLMRERNRTVLAGLPLSNRRPDGLASRDLGSDPGCQAGSENPAPPGMSSRETIRD